MIQSTMMRRQGSSPLDIGRQCAKGLAGHRQPGVGAERSDSGQKGPSVHPRRVEIQVVLVQRDASELLTFGTVPVRCRPVTYGEFPATTRDPARGRSSWHAPGRDPTGLEGGEW